ncbi:MAG: S9 family peptidase [Prevotellaceae bacterium]|jgi:dipeptidyl-peptidase-4|nr:S9 family peptidase [Prevotellaceae bacterium]
MLKKTFFIAFFALLGCTMQVSAQTLTLEDLIPGGNTYLRPQMPPLQWRDNQLTFVRNDSLFVFNPDGSDKFVRLVLKSALGSSFAYTIDNNLYFMDSIGTEIAITNNEDRNIVSGQSVSRNEFGITAGFFWSPNKNRLAFYQKDESRVGDYPLVDVSAREAALKNVKYPMAGMASETVRVGVFDKRSKATIFLNTGIDSEKYLTNVAWSADEKTVYIAEINRGQDTCKLNSYDATTGNFLKTLFVETHPKYVEPEHPLVFLKNNPRQFIWQSKRDGHNHLYLYNADGQLLRQITSGAWDVVDFVGFNAQGTKILYISTEDTPLEKHIYSINIKTLKKQKLSTEPGVHFARQNPASNQMLDIYSSQHNPGKIALVDADTGKSKIIFEAKNPYASHRLPRIELGKLKADDGTTDLYYRMVRPLDFDSTQQYPVVVYVYGGPHSQMVENSWLASARGWDIFMAQKGYIVFTLDNRGTSNRGRDFENIIHRQLGEVETRDQMTGVNYLKSLPFVDADRMGVHGWSYGGFMTLNLMLRHPDTFKVGVAGGAVTDWQYYEVMYGERYMDTPQENPEGYQKSSMILRAGDLKGRLLLIHGDQDATVVMQHNLLFLQSCIEHGTFPHSFTYPGHEHNMRGHDRVHLHQYITNYFDEGLK